MSKRKSKREATPDTLNSSNEVREVEMIPPPIFDHELLELKISETMLTELIGEDLPRIEKNHKGSYIESYFFKHEEKPESMTKKGKAALLKHDPQLTKAANEYSVLHLKKRLSQPKSYADWYAAGFGPKREKYSGATYTNLAGLPEHFYLKALEKNDLSKELIPKDMRNKIRTIENINIELSDTTSIASSNCKSIEMKPRSTSPSRALSNWVKNLEERKTIENFIKSKISRHTSKLLMNSGELMPIVMEERELMDRVLPLVENGHGSKYHLISLITNSGRYKSEFWQQNEPLRKSNDTGVL
ncbi:hypothetical protein Ciccas_008475 [Cichlidogyrus casuarinus]|uniref:Uncharacterized protein n=1 Tax=Cichlidogyrus casuarinus TaxID=1844966 RepID=A0ABD2Q1C5_9PLAT